MSGEAAKERATSTYLRVPSESVFEINIFPYLEPKH